jgi:hypothetical protein
VTAVPWSLRKQVVPIDYLAREDLLEVGPSVHPSDRGPPKAHLLRVVSQNRAAAFPSAEYRPCLVFPKTRPSFGRPRPCVMAPVEPTAGLSPERRSLTRPPTTIARRTGAATAGCRRVAVLRDTSAMVAAGVHGIICSPPRCGWKNDRRRGCLPYRSGPSRDRQLAHSCATSTGNSEISHGHRASVSRFSRQAIVPSVHSCQQDGSWAMTAPMQGDAS